MEYLIIHDVNLDNLIGKVNKAIEEGWVPLGGIAYGSIRWAQAMTKHVVAGVKEG